MTSTTAATGAILLAGGAGTRVGGAVKALFEVGGRTLLRRATDAVAGCHPITVAAPVLDESLPVMWVREDPPLSGPAAGIVAALASWPDGDDPPWSFVLACDLADPEAAVAALTQARDLLPADTEGVCLADASGRPQWLTGLYRTAVLRAGAAALPDAGADAPVRALFADRAIAAVAAPARATADVDTWEDLDRARGETT